VSQTASRKKQGRHQNPVLIEGFPRRSLRAEPVRKHKRAGHGFGGKNHAATAAQNDVEPEAGRAVKRSMINLLHGVVTRRLTATDATHDRVGAHGAKLLNGFHRIPLAGRPTASLPVRLTGDLHGGCGPKLTHGLTCAPLAGRDTLPAVRHRHPRAPRARCQASFLRHCPASEAVGSLTRMLGSKVRIAPPTAPT
jgi:hypothetical protein